MPPWFGTVSRKFTYDNNFNKCAAMKNILYLMLMQNLFFAECLNCYVCLKDECNIPPEQMQKKLCDGECCWSKGTPEEGVKVPSASGSKEELHFTEKSCCSEPTKAKYIDKMCQRLLIDPAVGHCYSCTTDLCNGPAIGPLPTTTKKLTQNPKGISCRELPSALIPFLVLSVILLLLRN